MTKTGRNEPCPCGSGRKYKHCCLGKEDGDLALRSVTQKGERVVFSFVDPSRHPWEEEADELWEEQDETFRQVMLGEGAEDLTDEVITELAGRGWTEADLRRMKAEGARYNRIRDSIVYPPEAI